MRNALLLLLCLLKAAILPAQSISDKERKFAEDYMKETRDEILSTVQHLSDAQLNFKPAPDRWSVKECVFHIALSDSLIMAGMLKLLEAPAEPGRRGEVKVSDTTVIRVLTDRSHKSTAADVLQPKEQFASVGLAIEAFRKYRAQNIEFIKTTPADLRDHFRQHPIMGTIDCYQQYLIIGAHSMRHLLQIREVMADPNFPAN